MTQNANHTTQPGWSDRKADALKRQAEHHRQIAEAGAANCEGPYEPADGKIGITGCIAIVALTVAIVAAMWEVFA